MLTRVGVADKWPYFVGERLPPSWGRPSGHTDTVRCTLLLQRCLLSHCAVYKHFYCKDEKTMCTNKHYYCKDANTLYAIKTLHHPLVLMQRCKHAHFISCFTTQLMESTTDNAFTGFCLCSYRRCNSLWYVIGFSLHVHCACAFVQCALCKCWWLNWAIVQFVSLRKIYSWCSCAMEWVLLLLT